MFLRDIPSVCIRFKTYSQHPSCAVVLWWGLTGLLSCFLLSNQGKSYVINASRMLDRDETNMNRLHFLQVLSLWTCKLQVLWIFQTQRAVSICSQCRDVLICKCSMFLGVAFSEHSVQLQTVRSLLPWDTATVVTVLWLISFWEVQRGVHREWNFRVVQRRFSHFESNWPYGPHCWWCRISWHLFVVEFALTLTLAVLFALLQHKIVAKKTRSRKNSHCQDLSCSLKF